MSNQQMQVSANSEISTALASVNLADVFALTHSNTPAVLNEALERFLAASSQEAQAIARFNSSFTKEPAQTTSQ